MEPEIAKALPEVITPERFTRIAMSAISANPQLAECTPVSFLASLMTAAQLGLEVNTPLGEAYLIPYYNGREGVLNCQFQLGYKGLLSLAYRSGNFIAIESRTVCANDGFEISFGLEPKLVCKPNITDRGDPVGYYALYRTVNGGYGMDYMSMAEIKLHRDEFCKSAGKGFSPWDTAFDEMAKKTVLKRCLKYAPLSSEAARAVASDSSVKSVIAVDMTEVVYEK